VDKTYDLAYHHKRLTPHEHSDACKPEQGRSAEQFLRCFKVELDKIRSDIRK
jgi:hypothetical protein